MNDLLTIAGVNTGPSKAQELAILDRTIAELGPDSYLGPWLTSIRNHCEQHLGNDWLPYTPAQLQAQAVRVMSAANAEAKTAIETAGKERDAIINAAHDQTNRVRDTLRRQLENALRRLDG